MKVKDLIKNLSSMDPEAEVVVGGEAIHFIEQLPGYYDGSYECLIEDPSKKPYYAVEGMKFTRSKQKVVLHMLTLEDIIWNCETEEEVNNLKFEMEDLNEDHKKMIQRKIDKIKQEYFNYLKEKNMK